MSLVRAPRSVGEMMCLGARSPASGVSRYIKKKISGIGFAIKYSSDQEDNDAASVRLFPVVCRLERNFDLWSNPGAMYAQRFSLCDSGERLIATAIFGLCR